MKGTKNSDNLSSLWTGSDFPEMHLKWDFLLRTRDSSHRRGRYWANRLWERVDWGAALRFRRLKACGHCQDMVAPSTAVLCSSSQEMGERNGGRGLRVFITMSREELLESLNHYVVHLGLRYHWMLNYTGINFFFNVAFGHRGDPAHTRPETECLLKWCTLGHKKKKKWGSGPLPTGDTAVA